MELFKSIFSQIRMDYEMPQASETKDLNLDNKNLNTSLNSIKIEMDNENYLTCDTTDNVDEIVLNSYSTDLDIDNENLKPELETVLTPDDQIIKTTEYDDVDVDVKYINDSGDLPAVLLDEPQFIPFNNIAYSLKETELNQTQTEVGVNDILNYEMYAENIKKVDITDEMNEYNNTADIVDLDEFKEFFDFDYDNVIESYTITNEKLKTRENQLKEISEIAFSKKLEAQSIFDTNNEFTAKNLDENIISDKESILSISSDDELNDLKLTLSLTDLETISLSSQDIVAIEKNLDRNVQTVTQLKSFDNAVNELTHDSNENCNLIINRTKISLDDSDSCSSYHSSDFEFITEDEAKETNKLAFETSTIIEISLDIDSSECEKTKDKEVASTKKDNSSTSRDYRNAAARYFNNNFRRQNIMDYSYRQDHCIPEGDNYLHLFEGTFEPRVTCMMENKMTEPSSIYVQYEGIGFDMRTINDLDSDAEFVEEANQSARKILKIYPHDNRKRRRF